MLISYAAAHQEPRQVGNLIGLLIGIVVVWAGYHVHQRWMKLSQEDHSPTAGPASLEGVKSQVNDLDDPEMTPGGAVATRGDDDLESFVDANAGKLKRRDLIALARARFNRSESTVKRALRKTKEAKT